MTPSNTVYPYIMKKRGISIRSDMMWVSNNNNVEVYQLIKVYLKRVRNEV